mmetsp:Transcript_17762/g.35725  ORF Transcript_17762/g.35725 Transcript_17762/m.35725 type:complete len:135 (-) Transcript_17762:3022-3426(-)
MGSGISREYTYLLHCPLPGFPAFSLRSRARGSLISRAQRTTRKRQRTGLCWSLCALPALLVGHLRPTEVHVFGRTAQAPQMYGKQQVRWSDSSGTVKCGPSHPLPPDRPRPAAADTATGNRFHCPRCRREGRQR